MIKIILGLIPGAGAMSWVINTVKNKHLFAVAFLAMVSISALFGFVLYDQISGDFQDKKIEECRKQTETSLEECWNKVLN